MIEVSLVVGSEDWLCRCQSCKISTAELETAPQEHGARVVVAGNLKWGGPAGREWPSSSQPNEAEGSICSVPPSHTEYLGRELIKGCVGRAGRVIGSPGSEAGERQVTVAAERGARPGQGLLPRRPPCQNTVANKLICSHLIDYSTEHELPRTELQILQYMRYYSATQPVQPGPG